ncbi:MAG: hypothetical protein LPK19_07445, partial [Hymenobacteraceae bacterium]|nr:hypothetical protein [Hymenobacteraceae bacterium]MDX5396045.1 hypothetical protein [Hymenobacteraceae bacterium]MDX5512106.1 hypothetical protein [Hymenobacteraceae bacterium]
TRIQLNYNSQTIIFESALNDLFDSGLRRIYILNNPAAPPYNHEFARSENEPDQFEYSRSEAQPDELEWNSFEYKYPVGFHIMVPAALSNQEKAIRTFVEKIKFAVIRYEIKYF